MKKVLIGSFAVMSLLACGNAKSGAGLAKEVCDCYAKANGMDAADPKRAAAQDDCLKKQAEAWNKIKNDSRKMEEFNKAVGDCSKAMMQKSLGQ